MISVVLALFLIYTNVRAVILMSRFMPINFKTLYLM